MIWKAKYFPERDLLNAGIGYQPSYAWRSVWSVLSMIREGIEWRVGNGENINIWKDLWLPGTSDGYVLSNVHPQLEDGKVADLFLMEGSCNNQVLNQFFSSAEAKIIESIPLSWRDIEDRLICRWNRDGTFNVKSIYYHLQAAKISETASGSSDVIFPCKNYGLLLSC